MARPGLIVGFLLYIASLSEPISAADTFASHRSICRNSVSILGPSAVDKTVGVVSVYTFPADWEGVMGLLKSKLKGQKDFSDCRGFAGMRNLWNSTDHSLSWTRGDAFSGIGLMNNFRASRHRIEHPYAPKLYGRRVKGWITAYTFDGKFVDR